MITCILLAAGSSTRFGSPKALARIGPKNAIETALWTLSETKISETIVVLGADADLVAASIPKDERIKTTVNKNYTEGQTSSFKTGLSLVSGDTEGILLLPIDVPFVKSGTIDALLKAFLKNNATIVVPTFDGKKGHPPVFSKKLFQEFRTLTNETPLSSVLRAHENAILKVPVKDAGVLLSFNTREELATILHSSLLRLSALSQA